MVKVGLEIHQQLDTGKLFCNCPSIIKEGDSDYVIKRRLRASAGEGGELDRAAAQEVRKDKEFHYHGFFDNTCQVELDEEPPHPLNPEALAVVLEVAGMLNAKVLDKIIVMRKIVLDGSNTSGFQRTALVAINGHFEIDGKRIGVPTICIEEDAAKIIERTEKFDVYDLSRLGVPLVEIATDPDITSAEMCKKAAEYLGMVLRSVGGVKRGLGSIRQDVNVSIPDGARVEIKGAQDLRLLAELVENEVKRQQGILEISKEYAIRKVKLQAQKPQELSNIFAKGNCAIIKSALDKGGIVAGIKLNGMKGLIGRELQPGKRFGTEMSVYSKVHAGTTGLFHCDELPRYGITEEDVAAINKVLECNTQDGFILIAGDKQTVMKGLECAFERASELLTGVPKEVRKAEPDGTTSHLRAMSSGARMYPETDIPIITPPKHKAVGKILLADLAKELETKHGISSDLAKLTVKSLKVDFIVGLISRFRNVKPSYLAETVLKADKEIKKEFNKDISVTDAAFESVFSLLNDGKVPKEAVLEILSKSDKTEVNELAKAHGAADGKQLEAEILQLIKQNRDASFNALMGMVMAKFKGRVSGVMVAEILKKHQKS